MSGSGTCCGSRGAGVRGEVGVVAHAPASGRGGIGVRARAPDDSVLCLGRREEGGELGAAQTEVVPSPAVIAGWEISGKAVRVMRFQLSVRVNGTRQLSSALPEAVVEDLASRFAVETSWAGRVCRVVSLATTASNASGPCGWA
jgi:hypothetical protein